MEFDTATLRPTYRFMQGVLAEAMPEIAKRLGLSSYRRGCQSAG